MTKRNITMSCLVALTLAGASVPAFSDAVVKVSLEDKGVEMDLSKPMSLGMGMQGDVKMALMSIVTDKKAIHAGKVRFEVTNASKETIHEMIVAPIEGENAILAYNAKEPLIN